MELKEFVKNVLIQVNAAVDEASEETSREIRFSRPSINSRTVEFDIAISAEHSDGIQGKAGVKVLSFMDASGDMHKENKNSTVSKVTFGLSIEHNTKTEEAAKEKKYQKDKRELERMNRSR